MGVAADLNGEEGVQGERFAANAEDRRACRSEGTGMHLFEWRVQQQARAEDPHRRSGQARCRAPAAHVGSRIPDAVLRLRR